MKAPEMGFLERIYLVEVLKGLLVTSRHFFINLWRHMKKALGRETEPGAVTIQYPEDPAVVARRSRTHHRLLRREDGAPRCAACMLCETICPAKCIRIVAEESPDVMIEKRAKSFEIDLGRCVFCGFCVEACPVDAIRMDTGRVEMAAFWRTDMARDITQLLGERPRQ
ncbi:MAG: NADH-quinone oxidoreductase subunit I [Elusimicrobia bacterium]|nr:NADH-quinone oxidoreductase subunit I [Elusimicrobiota bacterium]